MKLPLIQLSDLVCVEIMRLTVVREVYSSLLLTICSYAGLQKTKPNQQELPAYVNHTVIIGCYKG